ncbi:hypothetical protein [Telmatospirillum sp. J64-1]|uniref:hypothetical protein n=1 Tax=Telmatospirillum sp. J64-1 TaxID=2502183 RepID=UPI002105CB67|nr:hypothetical protein [Telmatospirillum sp. J64-1]
MRANTRVWAVAAIHGQVDRLRALHDKLSGELALGDQIVYLGNFLGHGPAVRETVEELLLFRRAVMARTCEDGASLVYLRGQQEEMWQKLLQLQFAPNPSEVLQWLADNGIEATVNAYGGRLREGFTYIRDGVLPLTRWTSSLRQSMRQHDGHTQLMSVLRHAAYTEDGRLLLVSAGIDPRRPLEDQGDAFWWGSGGFVELAESYSGFGCVVRGFDRAHSGPAFGSVSATLDAGCGFGGPLVAAAFDPDGSVGTVIEA